MKEQAGADAVLTQLFDAHWTRMLRVAVVLLHDQASAEDVVQDAFVALHTHWDRIRNHQDAAGYLHRSVVNGARSKLRRRLVADRLRPLPSEDALSAETAALAGLVPGTLLAAMRALPRREREAVLLRHYLDLSELQTAGAMGIRPGSVKGYTSRGLATLRAAMHPERGREQ